MDDTSIYGPINASYYDDIYVYALKAYDSTTGKKFFTLEDGCINPTKVLTVADAAEYALKFYHYPNPMAYPEFVAPENVGTYNENTITAELLTKDTDLPEPSCTYLPANWHGVVMKDMGYQMRTTHLDDRIYEYEIKAIKEAGFNFMVWNWISAGFRKPFCRISNLTNTMDLSAARMWVSSAFPGWSSWIRSLPCV